MIDKKILIQVLNKAFHDEPLDIANLKSILEMYVEECSDEIELKMICVLIAALSARQLIAETATPVFYEFRSLLEKEESE